MKKRLLVILLSAAVLFTFMPAMAFAEEAAAPDETTIASPQAQGWDSTHTYYTTSDGEYATGWYYIDGRWYHFRDDGRVCKGWFYTNAGRWCYYGDPVTGLPWTGWHKIGGYWYYFAKIDDPNDYDEGRMYDNGPMELNGKWYYFAESDNAARWGKMQTGWVKETRTETYDGRTYTDTDWWYADPAKDSQLAIGWKKIGGKWYYFVCEPGDFWYCEMAANDTWKIDGKQYAFNRNGSLHETAGWVDLYEEWTDTNGKKQKESYWVYTDSKGVVVTGWKKIGGSWYHFDDQGYMDYNCFAEDSKGLMWLGSDGKPFYSKWLKLDEEWVYLKANGYQAMDEWVKVGGVWYFFDGAGYMVHDSWAEDSIGWMWMGSDGKPVRSKWIRDPYDGEWHYIKANGYEATNEWAKDSHGWMFMSEGGTPVSDQFVDWNENYYYIKPDGYMATSSMYIGEKYYEIGADGIIKNFDD